MAFTKTCGQHTEIASNSAVRVTRCSCGTVHLTLIANGVTVRLSAEAFRNAAAGLQIAIDRIDEEASATDATIN
ncbi:hypothetical protein [Polyangium aurulentum]|uniref:hypothetical protein n=1 Tax=Polyangium aurulentum TaxID=2567896 RepID=UPI0010AE3101|nr:hypothetical protein [Polyangium aurulentum]UQA61032.1 hypothetical protein E8A73_011365 [Polyangium aurulentum]